MKKKAIALVLVMVLGMLSACGKGGAQNSSSTGQLASGSSDSASAGSDQGKIASGKKVKIVEWSQGEKVMKVKKEVGAKVFPNIDYEYVLVNNGDYVTKLQAAIAAGTDVPDIITVEITSRGAIFALDILENLEAAPYNYNRNELFPAVIPALTNGRGQLVALDNQFCPSGFAYNRAMTQKYFGVSEPDDVYKLVKDWNTFIQTGLTLKQKSGGTVNMMQGMFDLLELLSGQDVKNYINGDNVNVTNRYKAAIEMACKIRDAGVPLAKNEKNSTTWNSAYTNGSVMFFNHASWSTNSCIASNDPDKKTMGQWGFCMAPGGGWMNGGTSVGIYKNSPNKEAAWEFTKYFLGTKEGYKNIYDRVGWIPSFKSFYEGDNAPINGKFMYQDWFDGQNYTKYIYDNIGTGITPYEQQTSHTTLVTNCFRDMSLQYLINPKMNAAEGLKYMKDQLVLQDPTLKIS